MSAEPQTAHEPLLAVRDLTIRYHSPQSEQTPAAAVAGVSFSLAPGDSLGIFGQSGSGKTTLARSLLGLGTREYRAISGSILFRGAEIVGSPRARLQEIRGRDIALISQEPELALNPVLTVGEQIVEVLRAHVPGPIRAHRERAKWMLAKVRLDDQAIYRSYPHQLSGGQRQRVAIAQSLACTPALLIADEPTSALDLRNQAEIALLLQALKQELNLSLILISHNVQFLRGVTNRVACMNEGRMTENAVADTSRPASSSRPRAAEIREGGGDPLIEASGLCKYYRRGARWSSHGERVAALAGVDFAIQRGQTIAVVGESGSGKTTLARCLALAECPDAGEIRFEGKHLRGLRGRDMAGIRRRIQLVFQHSALALNPRLSAGEIVSEPLLLQGGISGEQRRHAAMNWMDQVGLSPLWAGRRPWQLSGGQRQRLAIARAMILDPDVVIFDEALAGLDSATCTGIIQLLLGLQSLRGTSYVFITHDLKMAKDLTPTILAIENGRIADPRFLPGFPVGTVQQSPCISHS